MKVRVLAGIRCRMGYIDTSELFVRFNNAARCLQVIAMFDMCVCVHQMLLKQSVRE